MSFFQKLRNALSRFMYGRYGNDALNQLLCVVILALYVLGLFLRWVPVLGAVLYYLPTALWLVVLFRMLSKNLTKRRQENEWFLSWWNPMRTSLRRRRDRMKDREHKYFTCRGCGTVCRVPRGRGKIIITCPRCGRELHGKS